LNIHKMKKIYTDPMKIPFVLLYISVSLLLGCNGQTQEKAKPGKHVPEINPVTRTRYSAMPGFCGDTCFGDFNDLGSKRIGNTLNIYISGMHVDLMRKCCQFAFSERVYNTGANDPGIEIIKTHLVDVEAFEIPKDTTEYGSSEIKKKVMCISINNLKTGQVKIIADPFKYGLYKKPKCWD
jgi:hypothetical protein